MNNWYKLAKIEQHPNLDMFQDQTTVHDYDYLLQNPQELEPTQEQKQHGYTPYPDIDSIKIQYMSPEEYLNKIKIGFWHKLSFEDKLEYGSTDTFWKKIDRLDKHTAQIYAKAALRGDKFPIPYIKYDIDNGYMTQEGHHRAEAARMLGIKSIPVCMINEDFGSLEENFESESESGELKQKAIEFIEDISLQETYDAFRYISIPEDAFMDDEKAMDFYYREIDNSQEKFISTGETDFLMNYENLSNAAKQDLTTLKYIHEYMSQNNINPEKASMQEIWEGLKYADDTGAFFHYMYTVDKMLNYLEHKGYIKDGFPLDAPYDIRNKIGFKDSEEYAKTIVDKYLNEEQLKKTLQKASLYYKMKGIGWGLEDRDERTKAEKEYEAFIIK